MASWTIFTIYIGCSVFSKYLSGIHASVFGEESKIVEHHESRDRRHILFPSTSVLQLTIGVSAAFDFVGEQSGQISYCFQQNVPLPSNFTELLELQGLRMKRNINFYAHLKDFFYRFHLNGTECLKKTICQIADTPLEGGLLEEVFNFIFGLNEIAHEDPFFQAEAVGRDTGDCNSAFPYCYETPLDLISQLTEVQTPTT